MLPSLMIPYIADISSLYPQYKNFGFFSTGEDSLGHALMYFQFHFSESRSFLLISENAVPIMSATWGGREVQVGN